MINFFNNIKQVTSISFVKEQKDTKESRSESKSQKAKQEFIKAQLMMKKPSNLFSNIFFYLFLLLVVFALLFGYEDSRTVGKEIPISEVVSLIKEDKVRDITISGDDIELLLNDGSKMYSKKEASISFDQILANNEIGIDKISGDLNIVDRVSVEQILGTVLTFGLPLLLLFLIFRSMKNASSDVLSFGKSRAKMFSKESSKITFKDVAGIKEAKTEMIEIVDFLKNPKKYRDLGARIPKGVLLVGPAGVGKTLLAKAIAGEANVPFFSVAGSEFMEMLVGVGSARVRDLFAMAKSSQPSLIFIDEIDAIGRQRGMGIGGGHDEREQTLNQILIEMDGFDTRTNVIVIAATNRPDMLDPALVRAGRFDRKITVPLPDLEDRKQILEIHMKGKPFSSDFDLDKVAKKTVGFSGADLENMLNESAILAAREDRTEITMRDLDEASLKVTMGPERRKLQDEGERKVIAYHEAGHALVGAKVGNLDPVARVTIVPRGGSLGHTSLPPERDRYNETKTRLLAMITMSMGGRAAEDIVFNEITTGARGDIEQATKIARAMVTEYGMSSLGNILMNEQSENYWLAKQMGEASSYSDETATKIDTEIKRIIDTCYDSAKKILIDNRGILDEIVKVLLEKETIDGDEFNSILQNKTI